MSHPLTPKPLPHRFRDGALRPGAVEGGGIVAGSDTLGVMHAAGERAKYMHQRGGRQVVRPVAAGGPGVSVKFYLIDQQNSGVETLLEDGQSYTFGYAGAVGAYRKDLVILLDEPNPTQKAMNYYFMLEFTYYVDNIGDGVGDTYGSGKVQYLNEPFSGEDITWENKPDYFGSSGFVSGGARLGAGGRVDASSSFAADWAGGIANDEDPKFGYRVQDSYRPKYGWVVHCADSYRNTHELQGEEWVFIRDDYVEMTIELASWHARISYV